MSYEAKFHPTKTAAELAAENPYIGEYEIAVASDTGRMKVGPGRYNGLSYADRGEAMNLSNHVFAGTDISYSTFEGANLENANLSAVLAAIGVNFNDTILAGATLPVTVASSSFKRANLAEAVLSSVDLTSSDLTDADLTSAVLTGANLTDANLTGANLTGADLTSANLGGTTLENAVLDRVTLNGCDLSGMNLSDKNLSYCTLRAITTVNTDFSNCSFNDADLFNADLSAAELAGTTFVFANMNGANFAGNDLTGVDFAHAYCNNVILTGATMPANASTKAAFKALVDVWNAGVTWIDGNPI